MSKHKILRSLVLGLAMVLVMGGAAYALTTVTGHLKFDGTVAGAIEKITFGTTGGSSIYDDWNLHIKTDDNLYLDVPGITNVSGDLLVEGELGAIGQTTLIDLDVLGDLDVTGAITGAIVVTGTTSTSFTVGSGSDAATTDMILQLGGTNPETAMWDASEGYFAFSDDLRTSGAVFADGGLDRSTGAALTIGGVNASSVVIYPNTYVSGTLTASAALQVAGAATLSSTLGLTGAATLGSTLGVTGATTLTGALITNGAITANGAATFNGNVTLGDAVGDAITANGAATFNGPVTLNATPTGAAGGWVTALNSNISSADVGTLGWLEFASTATSGDITGLRPIVTSNAASGGTNVRAVYGQAIVEDGKYAALLQGVLATASVAPGNAHVTDVHVLAGHFSTGANATITGDLYVGMMRAQTRGDESIAGNDVLLGLVNEAVGGAGREMDSAIRIFDTNVSANGFTYGIDMSGAVIGAADLRLQNGALIFNTDADTLTITEATVAISGNATVSGTLGVTGAVTTSDNVTMTVGDGEKLTIAKTDTGSDFGTALEITGGSASTYGQSNYTGTGNAEAPITVGQKSSVLSITGAGAHAGAQIHLQQDAAMSAATNVLSGLYVTASHGTVTSTNGAIEGVSVYARNASTGTAYALTGGLFMVYAGADSTTTYKKGLLVDVLDMATSHPSGGGTQGITVQLNPSSITNNMVEGILINQNSSNSIADFVRFNGKADYGLDMDSATIATADIRLSSGATIGSGASNPASCTKGSIFLNTNTGKLNVCETANTWTAK